MAFTVCGIIFQFIIKLDSSYLRAHFEERGFSVYVLYFAVDFLCEFVILMIVTIYLKRSGFF